MSETKNRDEIVALVAKAIEDANESWRRGEDTSPDQRDYVIFGDEILTREWGAAYIGSTEEGREFLADVLYEDCGETWATAEDVAREIVSQLTAE